MQVTNSRGTTGVLRTDRIHTRSHCLKHIQLSRHLLGWDVIRFDSAMQRELRDANSGRPKNQTWLHSAIYSMFQV